MSTPVTVYTKPRCVQCDATKRHLDKRGTEYVPVDITQDLAALEHVRSLGYLQVPVVIAGDNHWSGYVPDKLNALTTTNQEN
ncbi:glutaredoxin-like protein NrdH [Cellulosimicrobium funkei]|uniref:glutaredoxin-like protein NrdH n=1 Tax=Cellulosimicrobium funkei TaxID=264251 RepID=UPI00341E1F4F